MGCDYYIINQLKIEFADESENFNLECNIHRGYFDSYEFEMNSDCSVYEEQETEFINRTYLTVKYKPKVIYDDYNWLSDKFKDKYENYFGDLKIDLSRVKKITKEQVRKLRS